jgi:transglutaminase-like putative cysteine protease
VSAPEGAAPIGRGPRSLLGSVLAAGATCGSLLALSGLIEQGAWLSASCIAVVLLAALTAAVRAATRSVWLPSAVGLGAALLGLVIQYGGPQPGTPVLPGTTAISGAWALGQQGVRLIQDSMVPMPAERPGEFIVVAAAAGIFLLVDALALGADAPALAALPLMAFWLPAVFLAFPTNGWGLFWTGLCYLLLLAASASPPLKDSVRVRQTSAVVAGAIATLVVALVAAPVLTSLPSWAAVSLPSLGNGPVGPLQLSSDLDLRDSLGTRSGQTVLSYTVSTPARATAAPSSSDAGAPTPGASPTALSVVPSAAAVGPLRAFTVVQFDGRQWHRSDTGVSAPWASGAVLGGGPGTPTAIDASNPNVLDVTVKVGNLEQSQLPISTFARTLQVDGSWLYDATKDEVDGAHPTVAGQTYSMQVYVPTITADDLKAAVVGRPPGSDDYLQLPASQHIDDVRALAAQITSAATTPYAQALALQSYLRSTANFTYDTRVPPARSTDAVWDFLQDRRGYCVQFATAMAIMARTLGIPTRVAVGFLPGTPVQTGNHFEYDVTGKQAHAWPELYFQGYGWVRFEPTPAQQTGLPPAWSDPFANQGGSSTIPDDALHAGQHATATGPSAQAVAPRGGGGGGGTNPWLPVGLAGLVVALAAAVTFTLVRRRRQPVELTCEHAWHQLRRTLARHASIAWSDATTPRIAVRTVQERLAEQTGSGLDGPALDALTRLASAVEQERYAPRPAAPSSAELHHWLATVRHAVEQKVNERSPRGAAPSALPSGT